MGWPGRFCLMAYGGVASGADIRHSRRQLYFTNAKRQTT
jgi:hypothetical protein